MKTLSCGVVLILLLYAGPAPGRDIRSTKHNLSMNGPGTIGASSESRICVFCHIPHQADSATPYLWNRSDPAETYSPYISTTLKADVGQPTGASRMCLSCHDGTIALGAVASAVESPTAPEIPFRGGLRTLPEGRPANLGTDLSDDHPISFIYDEMLVLKNRRLRDPAMLPTRIKLENGQLQCTACHDPHDDTYGQFLVMENSASALCTSCHDFENWALSGHARSAALLNRTGGRWPTTEWATVGENGCEDCHTPHNAGNPQRLLRGADEESTCLACHDGGIAGSDLASAMAKPYGHKVRDDEGIHDPTEDFSFGLVPEHVACSDCHNPHQANGEPSPGGGIVSGALNGVSGIAATGQGVPEARYQYEICFKCHGDSPNNVAHTQPVTRQHNQINKRLVFDAANPSFHPIESPGKNPDVPGLVPPWTIGSIINCTDCHTGNDPLAPAGPHGSDFAHILKDQYITEDNTSESPAAYALCYQCHSRSLLLQTDLSFPHHKHVVEQNVPCSACHDPHGIDGMQGNAVNNSHLINFDLSIVSPNSDGRREYIALGRFNGRCFLTCHGKIHNPIDYPE